MKNIFMLFILFCAANSFAFTDYLVKINPNSDITRISQTFGAKRIRDDVFLVDKEHINKIKQFTNILYIEPNHKVKPLSIANDLSSDLWGLENKQYKNDANVVKAWTQTTGSKNIIVAVIDTGIDFQHPDLVENLWQNSKEINGQKGVDDDGNGFVDDIYGWNTVLNNAEIYDYRGHGTHVSGIIGAEGNNGIGVVGVNWNVSLMTLNMFPKVDDGTIADA
ncbi:S8 family serine peptidase, partial [bacterium]|nr:S8 family serine peptidase [bacterium]